MTRRLLISIPTGLNGTYVQSLAWWLTSVQVQSSVIDFGNALADATEDIQQRLWIREQARRFAVGWSAEQASLQWQDPKAIADIWAPMIPEGWSVCMTPVVGHPLPANRNEQARRALLRMDHATGTLVPTDFDAVLFIDSDNIPARLDLHLLCRDIEREDVDVVGGVYCLEDKDGPCPIVYRLSPDREGFLFDKETLAKEKGLYELPKGGLPTGCLLVKRRVLERMWEARRIWFKDRLRDGSLELHEIREILEQSKDEPKKARALLKTYADRHEKDWTLSGVGMWHVGEDIWFCRMCHDLGIRMWVDTRVFWGHLKQYENKRAFLRQEWVARRMFEIGAANPGREYREVMSEQAAKSAAKDDDGALRAAKGQVVNA